MAELRVQIVRFVDEHQPGVVVCEFTDANGKRHVIIDKVPIFTTEGLDATSEYPRPGAARCEVIARWQSADGLAVARITTLRPDSIESTDGCSEFVVSAALLSIDRQP